MNPAAESTPSRGGRNPNPGLGVFQWVLGRNIMADEKSGTGKKSRAGKPKNGRAGNATEEGVLERFARFMGIAAGRPGAFLLACAVVIAWTVTGPIFGFSDTWQLIINTATTIVTFLMVFLIQRSQNRDTMAIQAKLAELVIHIKGAKNEIAVAEDLSEHELQALHDLHSQEAQRRLDRMEDEVAAIRAGNRRPAGAK
jgi:low affinity Fe/Cu permease